MYWHSEQGERPAFQFRPGQLILQNERSDSSERESASHEHCKNTGGSQWCNCATIAEPGAPQLVQTGVLGMCWTPALAQCSGCV